MDDVEYITSLSKWFLIGFAYFFWRKVKQMHKMCCHTWEKQGIINLGFLECTNNQKPDYKKLSVYITYTMILSEILLICASFYF